VGQVAVHGEREDVPLGAQEAREDHRLRPPERGIVGVLHPPLVHQLLEHARQRDEHLDVEERARVDHRADQLGGRPLDEEVLAPGRQVPDPLLVRGF